MNSIGTAGYVAGGIAAVASALGASEVHRFATSDGDRPVARPLLTGLGAGVVALAGLGVAHTMLREHPRVLGGFERGHAGVMLAVGAVAALTGALLVGTSLVNASGHARDAKVARAT